MVAQLKLPVEIVECPIVRGEDGLALSSRNTLLDAAHRAAAPHIYAALRAAAEKSHELTPAELKAWVTAEVERNPLLKVIYYQSVDALTMQEVAAWSDSVRIQGCIAVQAGRHPFNRQYLYPIMKFQIEVIKSKIHRVTVTQADLNYVGSITIDEALMEAANVIEGEKVQIMDINNGERFETYIDQGRARQRLRLPERRRGTQGAGRRRHHHRILRADGFRGRQAVPPVDRIPRHGDQPAREITRPGAAAGRPDTKSPRKRRFFRLIRYLCRR